MSTLRRSLIEEIFYPAHEPRKASSEYRHLHHLLVVERNEPCWICGVRHSDLVKMTKDDQKRWQLETHHNEIEWAAANGVDIKEVMQDFPDVQDEATLRHWLDSEGNMLVLCATHHRGARTGIHMVTYPAWKLQRWQGKDWTFINQPESPLS